METFTVEGYKRKNKQWVPASFVTHDPRAVLNKLAIERVSKCDTGEVLYDREKVGVGFFKWWSENYKKTHEK